MCMPRGSPLDLTGGWRQLCVHLGFFSDRILCAMAEFRPTWYTAVPTVHQAILASAARHWETIASYPLRFIRSASAPLPRQVLAELERVFNAPVIESYGMTETAAQITSNPLPPRARKPGSVGRGGLEVAIMSPEAPYCPRVQSARSWCVVRPSSSAMRTIQQPTAVPLRRAGSGRVTKGFWIAMATYSLRAVSRRSSTVAEKKLPRRKWTMYSWSILRWPRR